jgi:hypothetical protein
MLKSALYLNQTGETFNSELENLLVATTKQVESYCNRALVSTAYTDKLMTRLKFSPNILYLPEIPATSVTLKFWDTGTETYVTETASYYTVVDGLYIQYPALGKTSLATYAELPAGKNEIKITYTAGYVTTNWNTALPTAAFGVPADLEKAVCAIAHLAWQDGKEGGNRRGVTSVNVGGQGLTKEIFQTGAYPKDVERTLDKYSKLVV